MLIWGRRLLAFLSQMWRLFEEGSYLEAARIRVNAVCGKGSPERGIFLGYMYMNGKGMHDS